jgi:hypothetical protein
MRPSLLLALAALAACPGNSSKSDDTVRTPPAPAADAAPAAKEPVMNVTPVDMKFVGSNPGRPPMLRLQFDVTLNNGAAEPRWFLLPKEAKRAAKNGGGVDGVEVDALGNPPVLVGRFQGTDSVQALLLPAGGKISIERFTIVTFEDTQAGPASLEVVIARDLKIGGEDAAAWFKTDPTTPASADVSEDSQQRSGSRFTKDRSEVPITFTEDQRVKVAYTITF